MFGSLTHSDIVVLQSIRALVRPVVQALHAYAYFRYDHEYVFDQLDCQSTNNTTRG